MYNVNDGGRRLCRRPVLCPGCRGAVKIFTDIERSYESVRPLGLPFKIPDKPANHLAGVLVVNSCPLVIIAGAYIITCHLALYFSVLGSEVLYYLITHNL